MRWPLIIMAVAAWVALEIYRSAVGPITSPSGLPLMFAAIRALQAWTMILALFGFARKHLRHDSSVRRYLTDAIFPFYIIHQTAIVIAGFYLDRIGLPLWFEASLLISITFASCWLGFEIARRIAFLRPLFGLKVESRQTACKAPAMA
jgi:glucan biosynthesis protein C